MKFNPVTGGQHPKATPTDFNALGRFAGATEGTWAKLPTYYYDLIPVQAPVPPEEFNATFGSTVDLFDVGTQSSARQTNAATGRTVNEVFCAVGASIVAVGEGEAFSVAGQALPSPDEGSDTPAVNSCLSGDGPGSNAVLQYGSPIWTAIEKMFLGYRFVMMSSRFVLVDELLMDIGMSPAPPEFIGAGDMLVSGMPGVRDTNDVILSKSITPSIQFFPQNVTGDENDECVSAPLVPAMKGHPRILGMSKRVYCFNHPICFFPGMTFQTNFIQTDELLIDQARNALRIRNETPSSLVVSAVDGAAGVRSDVTTIPGGTLHMGLILKGFALQPQAALDYLTSYLPRLSGSWRDMYTNNPYLGTLVMQAARSSGGIRGLLGNSKLSTEEQKQVASVLKAVSGQNLDG